MDGSICSFNQQRYFIYGYWISPPKKINPFLKVKVKSLSHVWLAVILWTVACKASPSVGFSRQEYWSGLPFPSPGDLPDPGIEPGAPALEADALTSFLLKAKAICFYLLEFSNYCQIDNFYHHFRFFKEWPQQLTLNF